MFPPTLKRDPDYLQFRPYRAIVASPKRRPPQGAGRKAFPAAVPPGEFIRRPRSRFLYAVLAAVVVGAGLLWRSPLVSLPPFLTKYGGSAWWSLLVFVGGGFVWPHLATWRLALVALAFSLGVEFSQLYHAPWIDQLRESRLGGLVLGSTFSWADLPAYAIGIFIGATAESGGRKRGAIPA